MTLNPASTRRLDRVLDALWCACSAPQALMALTALLAGTLAFAAIVPQQPARLEGAAAERWLTTAAASYQRAGPILEAIGAFDVLGSLWVRILLAALAFNLALRIAAQLRFVRRLWQHVQPFAAPSGLPLRHSTLLPVPFGPALTRVETTLRDRFPRIIIDAKAENAQLYAERRRVGALGPLLTYLGVLLVLLGLFVNDTAGWRAADIALAPGGTAILVPSDGLRLTLDAINGEDPTMSGVVTLDQGGKGKTVRLGFTRPANWGNVWLSQQATGPALTVTAQGSDRRPLPLQSLSPAGEVDQTLHILFQQAQGEQAFAIPTRNLTFRAVSYPAMPERGIQTPVFLVEGYRGTDPTPAVSELVEDETTVALENTELTIRRDRYVILEVAYLPGLLPLFLGVLLTLAGVSLSGFWGPVRAWTGMAAGPDDVAMAVRVAAPVESGQETVRLLQALELEAVAAEPAHES
jgi:hypothetical protein